MIRNVSFWGLMVLCVFLMNALADENWTGPWTHPWKAPLTLSNTSIFVYSIYCHFYHVKCKHAIYDDVVKTIWFHYDTFAIYCTELVRVLLFPKSRDETNEWINVMMCLWSDVVSLVISNLYIVDLHLMCLFAGEFTDFGLCYFIIVLYIVSKFISTATQQVFGL